jgi:hypothetical protein
VLGAGLGAGFVPGVVDSKFSSFKNRLNAEVAKKSIANHPGNKL